MTKYVINGVEMSEAEYKKSGWTIVDFDSAPELGRHGWSLTFFHNDENKYGEGYSWMENEKGNYI